MPETYELLHRKQASDDHTPSYAITVQSFDKDSKALSDCPKHRDGLGRVTLRPAGDKGDGYFLDPADAKLRPLIVQHSDTLKNQTPWAIQLAYWTCKSIISPEGLPNNGRHTRSEWAVFSAKLLPGAVALLVLLLLPSNLEGEMRNNGGYDPIIYREWLYARSARNRFEDEVIESEYQGYDQLRRPLSERSVVRGDEYGMLQSESGPKYLCFVRDQARSGDLPYECMSVKAFMQRTDTGRCPDYLFLSYTRKQFLVATDNMLREWNLPPAELAAKSAMAATDRRTLGLLGCQAAREAGVRAFWLDFECLIPDTAAGETADDMADVYRICDIVRASKTMAICRGPPIENKSQSPSIVNKTQWLRQWGSRLWTVPEAILCPSQEISIYTLGEANPEVMLKRGLGAVAWDDAASMGQVLQHFEGSLHLTPLELVSITLEGLMRRQTDMRSFVSDMRSTGDVSYSLMGLLRRRPLVNKQDSDFEAFARLSLSNDSDKLLERLICFLPLSHNAPWHEMKDAWHAKLWDVEPHCQIAGIVDNRTVVLDGAFGATIQWHRLSKVGFFKRRTILRMISILLVRTAPGFVLMLAILAGTISPFAGVLSGAASQDYDGEISYGGTSPVTVALAVLTTLVGLMALAVPWFLLKLYRGKFWSTQAFFFGIKGIPDLGDVEEKMFGINCGRLKWSAAGSPLSRHQSVEGERVGLPPSGSSDGTGLQLFTIVDTFTMTATAFYASKPPSVAIVCGREGGMQRALLCSYDWKRQTFCRQTVVRMKTLVLQRMGRVDRFRLCLNEDERDAA